MKLMAIVFILGLSSGCGLFGGGANGPSMVAPPPQKVGDGDLKTIVNATPAELNNKNYNATGNKSASSASAVTRNQPRIQEGRSAGGTVSEIKVNNKGDIPDYYIYPSQQEQNSVVNTRPDMNVSTPNWQINW